jgi:hypothetical protein
MTLVQLSFIINSTKLYAGLGEKKLAFDKEIMKQKMCGLVLHLLFKYHLINKNVLACLLFISFFGQASNSFFM